MAGNQWKNRLNPSADSWKWLTHLCVCFLPLLIIYRTKLRKWFEFFEKNKQQTPIQASQESNALFSVTCH